MSKTFARWLVSVTCAIALLAACKHEEPAGSKSASEVAQPSALQPTAAEPGKPPAAADKLVVFAASSLKEAFTKIGDALKQQHKGLELTFNFAGTQELRMQIEQGAPADVFAPADRAAMDALVKSGKVHPGLTFARNELVLALAKDQLGTVQQFSDLPKVKRIVLGAPEVPVGQYTEQLLDNASKQLGAKFRTDVEAHVVSREPNVKQVLAKLALGEADAAIVYRSDVTSLRDKVVAVPVPAAWSVIAEYPVCDVVGAANPQQAQAFIALLQSPVGRNALLEAGFLPPATSAPAP
ncbi:MAG TPA: molybdate ABC transporter substrate-binding protein [Polyangiales bacterium]|jgi:molybdate transport system substrate-binding protein|nr:molybdate ABC transporter substrate-binding protein [Polyangiales bacterium]